MAQAAASKDTISVTTFYLDDQLFGIDIAGVREINDDLSITDVPLSQDFVRGVINLRGYIVTVIDLRAKLDIATLEELHSQNRIVVVNHDHEIVGLLVDRIADVVDINLREMEPPPANVCGVDGKNFRGVVKLNDGLLVLLNIEDILAHNKK